MRRHTLATLVLVPMLALGAAACGDDQKPGTGKPAASDDEKMRQYARCMRANGVNMPDPSADGKLTVRHEGDGAASGAKNFDATMKAADRKCRHLMPNGGKPGKPNPEELARARQTSKCMRENGVPNFPDPGPDGGIAIEAGRNGGINPQSQTFKKAQKKCMSKGEGISVGSDNGSGGSSGGGE